MADQARERAFAEVLFKRLGIHPAGIESRERPDLMFQVAGQTIGMEITESTPAEKHWGRNIVEKLRCDPLNPVFYSTSHLRNHGRQRTREELFQDMFNNPDFVDMAEDRKRWCEDVRSQWARKREKLNEPSFARFNENWLLIWDNEGLDDDLSTYESIGSEVVRTRFFSPEEAEFDHVYVLSGNYTFAFVPGKVAFAHENADEMNRWLDQARSRKS